MRNTTSKFPNEIDDRLFLSDVSLSQVPIMNEYRSLLNKGDYSSASALLNDSGVFYYGAWILNLLEDRLCKIGEAIMNEEDHSLMTYNTLTMSQMNDVTLGMNWITDEEIITPDEPELEPEEPDEPSNDDTTEYTMYDTNGEFVELYHAKLHLGDTAPSNVLSISEAWIENGNSTTTSIDVDNISMTYQSSEPSNVSLNNLWIGD